MPLVTAPARSNLPDRIVLYGVEGVGKTTWAASSPNPVFLLAEDGVRNIDVPKLMATDGSSIGSFVQVLDALKALAEEPHDFKTLVVDTLDWLQPMVRAHVLGLHCDQSDEKYDAFGRGIVFSMNYWRQLLDAFDVLRRKRGMEIILLAHAQLRGEESASLGTEVKRFGLKLAETKQAKIGELIKEWADCLLFANLDEVRVAEGKGDAMKLKAKPTGRRIVKTVRGMMWEAKTRWALPDELPLSYAEYAKKRGVLSRLPEFREQAAKLIECLVPHPAHAEMCEAVKLAHDNEAELGGVIQSLEAALANLPETF